MLRGPGCVWGCLVWGCQVGVGRPRGWMSGLPLPRGPQGFPQEAHGIKSNDMAASYIGMARGTNKAVRSGAGQGWAAVGSTWARITHSCGKQSCVLWVKGSGWGGWGGHMQRRRPGQATSGQGAHAISLHDPPPRRIIPSLSQPTPSAHLVGRGGHYTHPTLCYIRRTHRFRCATR